jgi:hypothetical protein
MAEESTGSGWLPPRAPGGQPPPRFDMSTPEPAPVPAAAPAAVAPAPYVRARRAPLERNGLALTSLILGLVGLLLLLFSLGWGFPVALPCSIGAWLCGANARTRINLGESTTGRGQAQAGYLLGVAGVVIGVAAAVGWIVWLANGGDIDQLQRDLQRWRDQQQSGQALVQAIGLLLGR